MTALAIAFVTLGAISTAAAQDGDVEIEVSGAQASVTVVVPGEITLGPAAPGALPDWPYTCYWDNVFQETEVILGSAGSPIPGFRYWLRCVPNRDGARSDRPVRGVRPRRPGARCCRHHLDRARRRRRAQLEPDPLEVGISPTDLQITGVETWLWPEGSIESVAQTASTNGLAVTVQARWSHTVFDVDDETEPVVCEAQHPWASGRESSDCSHIYLTEGDRVVTATSHWDVVWWDNAAQPLPIFLETVELVEVLDVPVVDLEAVITARR